MLLVPAFLFTIGVCSEYEACLAHCPSTLAPAAVSDMQRTAALLVGNAMHSLRRCASSKHKMYGPRRIRLSGAILGIHLLDFCRATTCLIFALETFQPCVCQPLASWSTHMHLHEYHAKACSHQSPAVRKAGDIHGLGWS